MELYRQGVSETPLTNLVRANRIKCETRFAEVVHDRLANALEFLAGVCREAERTERLLEVETNPDARDALDETLGLCIGNLETSGGGFYPWHVLDSIDPRMDFSGYIDPVAAMWCSGPIPQSYTVADEHLCGLGAIIARIAADTGIRFTTYLCFKSIGPDGAADLDPAIYETPIDNHRYR